jgi:hypothetical protein
MAHFAKIENNVVAQVIVIDNENETNGQEFINSLGIDGTWIQTSYNGTIRKNFAGIGYTYDENLDAFIPPKPYQSWVLDEETCTWNSPIEKPTDNAYAWDEQTLSWINI